jgi:hypothetical protein
MIRQTWRLAKSLPCRSKGGVLGTVGMQNFALERHKHSRRELARRLLDSHKIVIHEPSVILKARFCAEGPHVSLHR